MDRNSDGVVSGSGDYVVALRKESVDRNPLNIGITAVDSMSLSARRAWIEICPKSAPYEAPISRSPQGERG